MDTKKCLENVTENLILANLPLNEQKKLRTHLELVSVETRQELDSVGGGLRYICFPVDCAISLMEHQPGGQRVEVAVIGKEGSTGFNAAQGLTTSPCRTIVQVGGSMYRLGVKWLNDSVPFLVNTLIRFGAVIFRHSVISVGCSSSIPWTSGWAVGSSPTNTAPDLRHFPSRISFWPSSLGFSGAPLRKR